MQDGCLVRPTHDRRPLILTQLRSLTARLGRGHRDQQPRRQAPLALRVLMDENQHAATVAGISPCDPRKAGAVAARSAVHMQDYILCR